jgi:hypothetical protein
MGKMRVMSRMRWFTFLIGLLVGALIILGFRFFTYSPEHVHYHANFAVYLNGNREQFKAAKYYEEVAVCSVDKIQTPQQRSHMHDNVNSVVHVHDHTVTWGQFFENLGWVIGSDFIVKDDGTKYIANGDSKLHILINDQDYTDLTSITNRVIQSRDRLLISFGNIDNPMLQQEYKSVPSTAQHYNETKDPTSCSGSEAVTPKDRLRHLF